MVIYSNIRAAAWVNHQFAYVKTKTQISCAVNAQLISAFVIATQIVQFLFYFYSKIQASSFLLRLYRPIFVGPGRNPKLLVSSCSGPYSVLDVQAINLCFCQLFILFLNLWNFKRVTISALCNSQMRFVVKDRKNALSNRQTSLCNVCTQE